MKNTFLFFLFFLAIFPFIGCAQQNEEFTLVTYNVENLFDADGIAIYNDYKPFNNNGEPQYSKEDVLNKVMNAVKVLKEYGDKGPDIISMVELESDFSPNGVNSKWENYSDFLEKYKNTTLVGMFTKDFNEEIADIPSHLLLLKAMEDSNMWDFHLDVGYSPLNENGVPETVQKVALYSRFPIIKEKSKIHPLFRARPILETWIDVKGNEFVVFGNHWKSGAGSYEMEIIRHQNAEVLRARLDELLLDNPDLDFVLAGDFNSDYNQDYRYKFEKTAVNTILGSTGNEEEMLNMNTSKVYNLWYDYPINKRGSESYRGRWGTLMQFMVSPGMYDGNGIQYVDNSIEVGDFGFNTFSTSGEPKRWTSTFDGSGYSDHLPISMKFRIAKENVEYENLSVNDDESWEPIQLNYSIPKEFLTENDFLAKTPSESPEFYNEYVFASAKVTAEFDFEVGGVVYDVYAPTFNLQTVLSEVAGTDKEIKFYGRFSQFRGNWQFIVESTDFIIIN